MTHLGKLIFAGFAAAALLVAAMIHNAVTS